MAMTGDRSASFPPGLWAYAAFVLLGLIWSSNFILMKWATALVSPSQVALLRMLFGFPPLVLFALATGLAPIARPAPRVPLRRDGAAADRDLLRGLRTLYYLTAHRIGAFVVGEPIRLLDLTAMAAVLVGVTLLQVGR